MIFFGRALEGKQLQRWKQTILPIHGSLYTELMPTELTWLENKIVGKQLAAIEKANSNKHARVQRLHNTGNNSAIRLFGRGYSK